MSTAKKLFDKEIESNGRSDEESKILDELGAEIDEIIRL